MKKLLVVALIMLAGVFSNDLMAQKKKKEIIKATFAIELCCPSCQARIEKNAASLGAGVRSVEVDLENDLVVVIYDSSKSTDKEIIEKFKKLKFEAKLKGKEPYKAKKK